MRALKPMIKKSGKHDRERKVLLGLIEHFLKTGKPVGSNTLKECGFDDLSSATIRNYFAHLETEGYLLQHHASGGRVPTDKAYRLYVDDLYDSMNNESPPVQSQTEFAELQNSETREIAAFLQRAAEKLADLSSSAVFMSAPRFEQDLVVGIKLIAIDHARCLCVIITDFGEVLTEILHPPHKLSNFSIKRIEDYFQWRITGLSKPDALTKEEEEVAQEFYNEVMLRYIVGYSNFINEDIYRTGFSKLLTYPEFQEPALLANSLALFENTHGMRLLLKDCSKHNKLRYWIGEDLLTYSPYAKPNCTVLAIPYYVNKQPVGAVGLLGPIRMPYKPLFEILHSFSESISNSLTKNLYKFKINMRQTKQQELDLKQKQLTGQRQLLIENKSNL